MTDDGRLSKVEILIQQKKFKEAERILKELYFHDSNNILFLSLLAEVNLQQDKLVEAKSLIDNAIGQSPDLPHLFYIKSRIAVQEDEYDEAEKNINEAIKLDPYNANYYAVFASVKLTRKQFETALSLANKALEIDSENLLGLNIRSTALLKLKRNNESFNTIEGALREDPNNAYTHANYGWGLLEKGDHKKAMEHFKESLKKDPSFEYAQMGMIEAIKATNLLYRLFLKYSFWIGNLTSKYQWGVIIGFYLGVRALRVIAQTNATLRPYLVPIIIAMVILAFSTWVMEPISNLFLRFNTYGQLLLNKKEKISSNFVAASLAIFLLGTLIYILTKEEYYLSIAVFGFAMMVPFSTMFKASKYKNALLVYAIVMGAIGSLAIAITFLTGNLFNFLAIGFLIGFIGFQWIANFLFIREDNK
jgi:tetratricopeptide (TPR) repeat protein